MTHGLPLEQTLQERVDLNPGTVEFQYSALAELPQRRRCAP